MQRTLVEQLLDEVAIIKVTLTSEQRKNLKLDHVAYLDGFGCSFYTTDFIGPSQLKVIDHGEESAAHIR